MSHSNGHPQESNKRSHITSKDTISNGRRQNKAPTHSISDTPQQSQFEDTSSGSSASSSDQESKELAPGLTDGSSSSSSGLDKSESPEQLNPGDHRAEQHMPSIENGLHRIDLRYDYKNSDLPVLPSLGKDSLVREAFSRPTESCPHDGRYHGLNNSVYREDQAWRLNPTSIHRLQEEVNDSGVSDRKGPNAAAIGSTKSQQAFTESAGSVEVAAADRPYRCTFENCNWSFLRSSDQKRHIRSHNKPMLQCPYWDLDQSCHRNSGAFNRLDVLKRHLRLMHYDQSVNTDRGRCKHCRRDFSSLKSFFEHCDSCARAISAGSSPTVPAAPAAPAAATMSRASRG